MISHLIASYRQRKAKRAASSLAKHGAAKRNASWRTLRDEKLAAFRADIAAGRTAGMGWKHG